MSRLVYLCPGHGCNMEKRSFRLTRVLIQGYKSIAFDRPVELVLGDVNLLLGANGSGKSNIISFFQMLSYMMTQAFGRYVEQEGTANSLLHYGIKKTPVMSGELEFADSGSTDTYRFSLTHAAPDRLIITEETITWHKKGENTPYKRLLDSNFKESSLCGDVDPVAKTIWKLLASCKVYQFNDSSAEGPLRQACPVETANYLQNHGNNLPSFLLHLKNNYPDCYVRIVRYVRDVVPQFQDFYLEPVGNYVSLRWMDNSATDYRFNAHQLSDGSIRFIALAALLLQPAETMPNVIILDGPELGLHPYAIAQLSEMIKEAAMHAQVVVATQSKDLVDYFGIEDISVVELAKEHQCTMVRRLKAEDCRHWMEEYSLSELWDKNIIGGRPV